MRSHTPWKRVALALGLVLWMSAAPGCSFCRSMGHYYSSGEWYEDAKEVGQAVLAVTVVTAAVVGLGILFSSLDREAGSTLSKYQKYGGSSSRGKRSGGYGWGDYHRTMSR